MFESAQSAFWQTLSELKPTHMLVLGKILWENLPPEGCDGPSLATDEGARETWFYPVGRQQVLATWIYHPSSFGRSSMASSHPVVREFLQTSCEQRPA